MTATLEPKMIITEDGTKEWWLNGKYHRVDGPAVIWPDGTEIWCINGKRHREDGPAAIYANGHKSWWIDDRKLSKEEFNNIG